MANEAFEQERAATKERQEMRQELINLLTRSSLDKANCNGKRPRPVTPLERRHSERRSSSK